MRSALSQDAMASAAGRQGRLPELQGLPISTPQLQPGGPGSAHLAAAMQLHKQQNNDMEHAELEVRI